MTWSRVFVSRRLFRGDSVTAGRRHGDEDKGDDDQEEEQEELGLAPERRATSTTSSTFHLTDASAVGPQGGRAAAVPSGPPPPRRPSGCQWAAAASSELMIHSTWIWCFGNPSTPPRFCFWFCLSFGRKRGFACSDKTLQSLYHAMFAQCYCSVGTFDCPAVGPSVTWPRCTVYFLEIICQWNPPPPFAQALLDLTPVLSGRITRPVLFRSSCP